MREAPWDFAFGSMHRSWVFSSVLLVSKSPVAGVKRYTPDSLGPARSDPAVPRQAFCWEL